MTTIRLIILGAFVVGIAYVAITYNNLWVNNSKQKGVIQNLTSTLTLTRDTLQHTKGEKTNLFARITDLLSTTATLSSVIDGYKIRDANARTRVYQKRAEQVQTDQKIQTDVGALSTVDQLKAANRLVAGFGTVPNDDSGKVAMIAGLKNVVVDRDCTSTAQQKEITAQTTRADNEYQRAEKFKQDKSDLERVLNDDHQAQADRVAEANKGSFIGRGKRVRIAIDDIRANRVKKSSK